MPDYQVVLIDLDETLLDFKTAGREALEASLEAAGSEFNPEVYRLFYATNGQVWCELEEGLITVSELRVERFSRFFKKLGLAIDPAEFARDYEARISSVTYHIEGAIGTLQELSKECEVVIITNGIAAIQHARLNRSPLLKLVKRVVISEEVGVSKPDPRIFEAAVKGLEPQERERMIMVGDSLASDIAGGLAFGIDTCWFNPEDLPADPEVVPSYEIKRLTELTRLILG